jgi:glycerol kinase
MRAVLALDQGSHASRACVFDQHGHLLAQQQQAVATRHGDGARVEQDPLELVQSLRAVAQQALAEARARHPHLEAVAAGLAVQRSTIVCCQREGLAALTPAISWQDRRHAAWLAGLAPRAARVRALTGLPLSPHFGASKLRWCLDELPTVQAAARAGELLALPLAAYLAGQLTGSEPRVDAANASRTLLHDTAQLDWSDELLTLFGIPRDCLPRCVPTGSHFGDLILDGVAVPLTALTGDQSAVPFAAGTLDLDSVSVNLGTGAFVQQPLAARPGSPAPLLGSVLGQFAGGARYSLEGTVNGAGSAVAAFIAVHDTGNPQLEPQLWAALETLDLRSMANWPLYLNGHGGLGSPWWQPQFPTRWLDAGTGEDATEGSSDTLTRFAALVESIAYMVAVNVAELARHGGAPGALRLTGGMSRSLFLRERLAAFCELPVWSGEPEASARGVAVLAQPDWGQAWRAAQQSGGTHAGAQLACTPPPDGTGRLVAQSRRARLDERYAEALGTASQPLK